MRFLLVDDEPLALEDLQETLAAVAGDAELVPFNSPSKALDCAAETPFDVAFLDIELGSMNGIVLAKKLKDLQSKVNIIFVTSHDKYAVDAFRLKATGYLLKPVTEEDVRCELSFLYGDVAEASRIRIQTFGGFDLFVDDMPVQFGRSKAKELLAYLVDRRGASVTTSELCAVLWEDAENIGAQKSYLRTIATSLRTTLEEAGVGQLLVKRFNSFAISPAEFDCDSYRFIEGDPIAINSYRGDYLKCYSWAEFSIATLERI